MDTIVGLIGLLFPGYFGLSLSEFFTGNRTRNSLSRNIYSIFFSLLAILELNLIIPEKWLNYFINNFLNKENSISAVYDYKIVGIIFILTILSLISSVLLTYILNNSWTRKIVSKIFKRSIDQNLIFSKLNHYSKNKITDILVKLKTGNFVIGRFTQGSDF
ncbi:hypothetical protein ND861_19560, partial [Leptospira sp. 2 VSF19]